MFDHSYSRLCSDKMIDWMIDWIEWSLIDRLIDGLIDSKCGRLIRSPRPGHNFVIVRGWFVTFRDFSCFVSSLVRVCSWLNFVRGLSFVTISWKWLVSWLFRDHFRISLRQSEHRWYNISITVVSSCLIHRIMSWSSWNHVSVAVIVIKSLSKESSRAFTGQHVYKDVHLGRYESSNQAHLSASRELSHRWQCRLSQHPSIIIQESMRCHILDGIVHCCWDDYTIMITVSIVDAVVVMFSCRISRFPFLIVHSSLFNCPSCKSFVT